MAGIAMATGDAGQADRLLDEATSVLGNAGPWFLMPVLYVRAILAVRRENPDEAILLVRENLTRQRNIRWCPQIRSIEIVTWRRVRECNGSSRQRARCTTVRFIHRCSE